MKLGLFGAARPAVASDLRGRDQLGSVRVTAAEDVERMSGLTPIEIAVVQAMSSPGTTLAPAQ
ncbi:hypothetical protein KCP91_06265 [Microvirga sp. SRT01]|uniref:Uncharacterized protein n=1 Tax=Sphingomonas longa TaxID=2778730 RepID=A0ABS2D7F3_9SPHN|nr:MULTISPECIES: hypothetical protein [Alphaproteobacteria]MBM6575969.1 hypothetical protein [Sphingomonas sp. BT552]MBR7709015.1 hypothetical protein [Microvirga sp. SRT01]